MRTLILMSLLASTEAMARPPTICVRQGSAVGLSPKLTSEVRGALGKTLAAHDVTVKCRGQDAALEISMIRVGPSLRLSFRLLRGKRELAVTHAMTDAADLALSLPDELWAAIEAFRPKPERVEAAPVATESLEAVDPTDESDATRSIEPATREPATREPAATTREPAAPWTRRDWGWLATGVGAALIAAAGVTGGLSLAKNSELSDLCPDQRCDPSDPRVAARDIEAENRQLHNLSLAFDILLPVGMVAVTGGILLLTVFDDEERTVALSPWLAPDSGGVVVGARF